jgi:hypothetical protein
VIFFMWVGMMVAMMLPTAAPTVLLVVALASDRLPNPNLVPATAMLFASGYLFVWFGFSLVATLLQWGLDDLGLLSKPMAFGSAILASTVLIVAGVYQWTPLKDTCLRHCRAPTEFLIRHWRGARLALYPSGSPRALLPGLLLDADVATVRRRIDEPRLGRRDRVVSAPRENRAMGRLDGPAYRAASDQLGRHGADPGFYEIKLVCAIVRVNASKAWPNRSRS